MNGTRIYPFLIGVIVASGLVLLAACGSAPQPNVNAAASNLASAQAQATITSGDATQAAAEANARLQTQYQQATQQAQAQQSAQQAAINSLMVERARTDATASAQKSQADVSSAYLQVTSQAQQIAATQVAIQATATKIVKETQNQTTIIDASAYINIAFDFILKIGIPLLAIFAALVWLRKFQQKESIVQPHPEGPAFYYKQRLLAAPDPFTLWNPYEEKFKWSVELKEPPLLPPPAEDYHQPIRSSDLKGNVSYVPAMTRAEARMRAYWKARVLRFLDDAIAVSGPDSQKIPRFDKMQVKSGDWVETTNTLLPHIFKEGRQPTLCLPPYESLSLLRDAVASGAITPLPQQVTLPKEETQGETDNRETGENSEKQRTTEDNRADPVVLDSAVRALPDWGGQYVPPNPPAPKPKAGLLRRVMDAAK